MDMVGDRAATVESILPNRDHIVMALHSMPQLPKGRRRSGYAKIESSIGVDQSIHREPGIPGFPQINDRLLAIDEHTAVGVRLQPE